MYRFGSHVSCAGGLLKAVDRASELGCQCLQVFVSPPRAWPTEKKLIPLVSTPKSKLASAKGGIENCHYDSPHDLQNPSRFRLAVENAGLACPIAHACYLINLASPDTTLWSKSVEALCVEWKRADELKIDGLVLHPGAHTTASVEEGIENVVRGIMLVQKRVNPIHCRLYLENTAGQGSCLGWRIEQLGRLISLIASPMVKICWDTCHALAAGYDFRTKRGMSEMVTELDAAGVLSEIEAVHINDSAKECGSRVDRHEHIGLGYIGMKGFKQFLKSPDFSHLPMYLETEKGLDDTGQDWDIRNLNTLRSIVSESLSESRGNA